MMAPELWAVLALVPLVGAAVAGGLALFRMAGPWRSVTVVARLAVCLVLVLVLLSFVGGSGATATSVPRTEILAAALATLIVYLAFELLLRVDAAAPIVDLVVMALVLIAYFAGMPPRSEPIQLQHAVLQKTSWVLLLVGAGAVMAAGSTGLMLALCAILRDRTPHMAWPDRLDLYTLLEQASSLALVALGAGMAVGGWWAWQTGRSFAMGGGDGDISWMAITWLLVAMGQLARGAGRRWAFWTASLAVSSAVAVLVGLLLFEVPANPL